MVYGRGILGVFLIVFMSASLFLTDVEGVAILDGQTPPVFEQISRKNGLSNMSVSSIIQDKDGFLWFGTQGGLNRYDGRTMTVIRNNPFVTEGLIHNLIQTMTYDPIKHELWLGTYQGISRYNIYKNTFINYSVEEHGLSNPVIVSIALDSEGLAWIGTLEGLNVLNPETGDVKSYSLPGDVVRSVFFASDDTIYLGTHDGLKIFDRSQDKVVSTEYVIEADAVMLIHENEPGILTLGLWEGGLMNINIETHQVEQTLFEDNRVYSYLKTSDGTQWVGTWGGGLFAIEKDGKVTHYPGNLPDGDVHHEVIYDLYQDSNDILWIGTNGGGITKVNPLKRNYVKLKSVKDQADSLSNGKNNMIFRDRYNQLWTAIYNQKIERIDESNLTTIKYDDDYQHQVGDNVICYLDHPDWPLLIGSSKGISYYDYLTDQFHYYEVPIPEDSLIYALEVDELGRLWIGTYREGVYVYDPEKESVIHYNIVGKDAGIISDNLVYDILSDGKGRVWVGTNNGLNLLEPGKKNFKIFKREDADHQKLPNNTIRKIFEDSNGDIWVATVGGGIAQYQEKTGQFITYTEADGLGNNSVVGILESNDQRLWLSTLDGISVLDLKTHKIYTLLEEDGIGGYEFNSGHFKDSDGSLYFAGSHGIVVMPGGFQRLKMNIPKLYIDGFSISGESYVKETPFFNDMELSLKPVENDILINFVALDFDAPEKVTYAYRLLEQDKSFIYSGTYNQAVFSNLPSGKYTFEVYAVTSRNMKTDPVTMSFTIANHWYQTPYAYLMYMLLLILFIYMLIKLRERNIIAAKNSQLNDINRQLEQANQQLERLSIVDALTGAFNRRHFEQILIEQLKLAIRGQLAMGFIMVDIDEFKQINDTYGHLLGDEVIKDVANAAKHILQRSTDYVFRYGGDEFLITLYDTDLEGVIRIASTLKEKLAEQNITTSEGDILEPISLSIGIVSEVPGHNTRPEMFIKKADDALYQAKKQGKNCIVHDGHVINIAQK